MIQSKQLLIDAIKGGCYPSPETCIKLTSINAMKFTGDQGNPKWEWKNGFLSDLNRTELSNIYAKYNSNEK